jgi:hypothetical protein
MPADALLSEDRRSFGRLPHKESDQQHQGRKKDKAERGAERVEGALHLIYAILRKRVRSIAAAISVFV